LLIFGVLHLEAAAAVVRNGSVAHSVAFLHAEAA
jgi:hypothetical protein